MSEPATSWEAESAKLRRELLEEQRQQFRIAPPYRMELHDNSPIHYQYPTETGIRSEWVDRYTGEVVGRSL